METIKVETVKEELIEKETIKVENEMKSNPVEHWTKEESLMLLKNLKAYGSHNISLLANGISSKSEEEIEAAILYFKQEANLTSTPEPESEKKTTWSNLLLDSYKFEELQTEMTIALQLIAEFEERPPSHLTDGIDFRKIYLLLAQAMQGKPISDNDENTLRYLREIAKDTDLTAKKLLKSPAYKNVIKSLSVEPQGRSPFIKPTDDAELALIRSLLTRKNYNPLGFTEEFLKL